jgi:hypothetical protein
LSFTQSWVEGVKRLVVTSIPSTQPSLNPLSYLTLLEVTEGLLEGNMLGDTNTIISIGVSIEEQNDAGLHLRPLSFDEMKVYHLRMTQDLYVPDHLKLEARHLKALKTKILLGQPVKLADEPTPQTVSTVVRIALGADMVVKAYTDKNGYDDYEDQLVVEKMRCLAKYWYIYTYIYVYIYVYLYKYIHIYIYIYIYIYISI